VACITRKNPAGLPYAELDSKISVLYLRTDEDAELEHVCQAIQTLKLEKGTCALGFGTQTPLPPQGERLGQPHQQVAIIQLALESQI
jgi:hypothetical protein